MHLNNIRQLLRRKYTPALILSTLFMATMLFLCHYYAVWYSFAPANYESDTCIDTIYHRNKQYVTSHADTLYYSGYDYLRNGQVRGYYYYTLADNYCTMYLLSANTVGNTETPPSTLTNISVKARLLPHDSNLKPLLDYMASDLNWNYYGIARYSSKIIISEVDYQPVFYLALLILCIYSMLQELVFIVRCILYHLRKSRSHPQSEVSF